MTREPLPPCGSPLLSLALAGLALWAGLNAAVAWRLYLWLRPGPEAKP